MTTPTTASVLAQWQAWGDGHASLLETIGVCNTEHFARLCWNLIVEPGDAFASACIDRLGPRGALETVAEMCDKTRLKLGEVEPPAALADIDGDFAAALERWGPRLGDVERVARAVKSSVSLGVRAIMPDNADWPAQLSLLGNHAPLLLWTSGNPAFLKTLLIGYVGARAATHYGVEVTGQLVHELASEGVGVVSGGAYGIDGAAHSAALHANVPNVVILAGGLDRLYPAGHQKLFENIKRHGVIVSEVPVGTTPTKWRFLMRNRIIASLSKALVIVEAGYRSGALNSAHHALQMGVPVGAVPGPIVSAMSAGCHKLLRSGGVELISRGSDILELISDENFALPGLERLDPVTQRVSDALTNKPIGEDEIALRSGCSPREVAGALAKLHAQGAAENTTFGWRLATAGNT